MSIAAMPCNPGIACSVGDGHTMKFRIIFL